MPHSERIRPYLAHIAYLLKMECYYCRAKGPLTPYFYQGVVRVMHPRCIDWIKGIKHKKGAQKQARFIEHKETGEVSVAQCICKKGFKPDCPYALSPAVSYGA